MTHSHNRYRIDPELHRRLLREAHEQGTSVRWLILTTLHDMLARSTRARRKKAGA